MDTLTHIARNIDHVKAEIAAAAQRANRDPDSVTLVAVTKTYPAEFITAAQQAGITDVGENRIQEAVPKIQALANQVDTPALNWHLIGHLQSNKAKLAVENFDLIHSVESVRLATEINRHAAANNRLMPILLQVNISGEDSKSGLEPRDTLATLKAILEACPHVLVEGFMTMAPFETAEEARPHFRGLREMKDTISKEINHPRFTGRHLSMGMSNDYTVAVEEGATLVRVGSLIFGQRDTKA